MKRLKERQRKKTSHLRLVDYFKKKSSKKNTAIVISSTLIIGTISLYITGYSSAVVDVYPAIKIGEKTTTLKCDYNGQSLSTEVKTSSNISNYYKNLSAKNRNFNTGDFAGFTKTNSNDNTIIKLASDIKDIAKSNNYSDDQTIELAACFVQNIPYDEDKANVVLGIGDIENRDLAQFPYETLYENSGICTDKTYLGSALINELGYGTGILLFPDAQHMALGIAAPGGYGDFETKYVYMEMTNSGFAPGEVPADVNEANGRAAVSITTLSDISIDQNPSDISYSYSESISQPNLVIDVGTGKEYQRIVAIRNLEDKIYSGLDNLVIKKATLDSSYNELINRDNAQERAYSSYLNTPDTKLDCGYKYDYSYRYSYSYDYSYSSPYKYSCEYITNPQKNYAYSSYLGSLRSYNNQVDFYNNLLNEYNALVASVESDIDRYKTYDYN
jgi:hypothetical protein